MSLAGLCRAEIIIVDDDGPADFNNIQTAINDSNDGDVIIVFPGTYTGPGNRDISFGGRAITVSSVAPEDPYVVAHTIVDCNGSESDPHRGFLFDNFEGRSSVLSGITIRNGWGIYGGGIIIGWPMDRSFPTIYNCIIESNFAQEDGGGIFYLCHYYLHFMIYAPQIIGCTIRNNSAGGNGGGIYGYYMCDWDCQDEPVVINCTISGNVASLNGGGLAGVIEANNCTITDNRAVVNGGGMWECESPIGCSIIGNSAGQNGGGVAESICLNSCLIVGNVAGVNGGGVAESICLHSCFIAGNTAAVNGGGVYNTSVYESTIGWNVAETGYGGGVYGGIRELTNCVFWSNSDSTGDILSGHTGDPSMENVYFSCIGDDDPNDANIPFGGADNNNFDDYPMFVRDPNDGGDGWGDDSDTNDVDEGANDDYGDLHLLIGSPCINSGDTPGWIDSNFVDIDGEPRVMGHKIDIGADEIYMQMLITTKPVGGEVWAAGSEHEVLWDSYDYDGNVAIALSRNGGGNWELIESEIGDTGSYLWQLASDIDSNECVIKVAPSVVDPNVFVIQSGLFTIGPYSPGPDVVSLWESLGGDYFRRGLSETVGPELGCVKWEFEVDGAISASVTIGPNDTVYVPCEDGNLYTLDANGSLLWTYEAGSPLISAATLGPDGTAYVGSKEGKLFAIDIDGNVRWTHTTDGLVYSSPAVSPDGNSVYVCSEDGNLYALGRDGSRLWSFETAGFGVVGGAILASPTIAEDGTVYIGGLYDSNLYALDPNDGSTNWVCHFDSNGWPVASPVVGPNGTIYQMLVYDANLYAIDPNNGSIIWAVDMADTNSGWYKPFEFSTDEYPIIPPSKCTQIDPVTMRCYLVGDSGWSEPAVGPEGTIYVSLADDPHLRAVDPNGSIKWVTQLGYTTGLSLTVGSDGSIYAAGDYKTFKVAQDMYCLFEPVYPTEDRVYLHVVDGNGSQVAEYDSNEWLGFPVISAEGTIVLANPADNTLLIAYEENAVTAISKHSCAGEPLPLYWLVDTNRDGQINMVDFANVAADWLTCTELVWPCSYCEVVFPEPYEFWIQEYLGGDSNRDLYLDIYDLAALAHRWLAGE
jgi:outer membrane protein assembly factor BamB